jgi:hypothetical protein
LSTAISTEKYSAVMYLIGAGCMTMILSGRKDKRMTNIKKSRSPRIEYEAKISHDVVIPDILYDGKIFNVSSGGIYFESNEQIEIGDEISVTVQRLDGGEMTFDVVITRREIIPRGPYRFGYGAIAVEPRKTLVQILDNDSTPKPQKIEDRRQNSRFDYNKILNIRYKRGEFSVWIKNISPGGAFFQTVLKMPVGKRLTLKMGGKKTGYIRRKGRIVRISEAGFGIKFDRQKIFFDQRGAKKYKLPEVKMDRKTFELEMMRAKTFMMIGEDYDYWAGYEKGLRRRFKGENFGTDNEQELWLSLANSDDDMRRNRDRGYHAGFNFPDS